MSAIHGRGSWKRIGYLIWDALVVPMIKMPVVVVAVCLAAGGITARAATRFSEQLTPAQRAAVGLNKLAPEEIAALDSLVADYCREAESKVRARAMDSVKKKEAELRRRDMLAKQKAEEARKQQAQIDGVFNGWNGHTLFRLKNGQIWLQIESADYYVPTVKSPHVVIEKSSYGGYRLVYPKTGAWVKVKRVR